MKSKYLKLIYSVLIVQFIGFLGALFTIDAIPNWYIYLNKPFFNPPNWLFGPVWTVLYFMIGISFFLFWTKATGDKAKKKAYIIFYVQLVLNLLWTMLFFGLKVPLLALIEIVFLWITILLNILSFYKLNKTSGLLLIPYLLWVSFASILNLSIVLLN